MSGQSACLNAFLAYSGFNSRGRCTDLSSPRVLEASVPGQGKPPLTGVPLKLIDETGEHTASQAEDEPWVQAAFRDRFGESWLNSTL